MDHKQHAHNCELVSSLRTPSVHRYGGSWRSGRNIAHGRAKTKLEKDWCYLANSQYNSGVRQTMESERCLRDSAKGVLRRSRTSGVHLTIVNDGLVVLSGRSGTRH